MTGVAALATVAAFFPAIAVRLRLRAAGDERRKTIDCLESLLETEKVGAEELDLFGRLSRTREAAEAA